MKKPPAAKPDGFFYSEQNIVCDEMKASHEKAQPDLEQLKVTLDTFCSAFDERKRNLLLRAADLRFDETSNASTDELFAAIETAQILKALELDIDTLAAALLAWRLPNDKPTIDAITTEFSPDIAQLVQGIGKMHALSSLSTSSGVQKNASKENLRRMLIAMIDDVRIVVIKLAEQLQILRSLKSADSADQIQAADDTLEIYAPLANRLGVWQLKWELEDLSLRYLHGEVYKDLARRLSEKRADREIYIEKFITNLGRALTNAGLVTEIYGRPKHIYSIWKKMRKKDLAFEHVFDVRAVRILVNDVAACYAALGTVHTKWPPISGEFDDYIATPKENGYQSIHTAVMGPEGKIVEVQIRTHDMHKENELGVAAHWRYKESPGKSPGKSRSMEEKILWLRQLLQWKEELDDSNNLIDHFRSDGLEERIYVFTPKGNVMDLPQGATPLDFAYAVHTEVGHRCRGAKVNGRIVNLNTPLNTGEQVEILTVKTGQPSRDWLNTHLGYLHTAKARSRVQHWFKEADFEQNLSGGRSMLEKELQRLNINDVRYDTLAQSLKYKSTDDFLAAIGSGDLRLSQALSPLRDRLKSERTVEPVVDLRRERRRRKSTGLKVRGVGNLLTSMGQCCNPLPGDEIVGYITLGRGVTIHRLDCANTLQAKRRNPDRLIEVDWGEQEHSHYPVDVSVLAYDRSGLIADITAVVADTKLSVLALDLQTDKQTHEVRIRLTLEVDDIKSLSRVLTRIQQIPNVTQVQRIVQ